MEELKHSRLGIASFITSIGSGILIFLLIVIAGIMESTTPGGMDEESPAAILLGLCLFAFIGAALVALGLGIAGLVQRDCKKVFAILGVIFSAVSLLVTILIILIGLAAGA